MNRRIATAVAVSLTLPAAALAQTKAPPVQFWMDVATVALSIPGMDDGGGGAAAMFGNAFGGAKSGFGSPGQWLDTALYVRAKPAGVEGRHAIPPVMNMGSMLPLVPVEAQRGKSGGNLDDDYEKPKGKLLFYWGCGDKVRPGQPRTVDFAKASPDEWMRFMTGRFAPDRGAKAIPGRSVWPNEKDRKRVPDGASLEGEHAVAGDAVPANLRFALREAYDFMPKLRMTANGDPKASVSVGWQPLATVQGYFLSAMGGRGDHEMIIWSSSDEPDPGWGLMDYVAPGQVKKLIGEKVVLAPSVQTCAIPAGIFAEADGAMVRMIAYGPELNLSHPPKPANAKPAWEPEWAARVRVKSTGMTVLGMEERGRDRSSRESRPADATGEIVPGVGNLLKGILGR